MRFLLGALVDFVWPPECPLCPAETPDDQLCRSCRSGLPRLLGDERRVPDVAHGALDGALALFRYEGPLRTLLLELKFAGGRRPARALSDLVRDALPPEDALGRPDAVVPLPLERRRLRRRGFNQARLLAAPVAAALEVPLLPRLLARAGRRPPQSRLEGRARRRNLEGAFRADGAVGRAVLLVDDVVTTGGTLLGAASALKAAGARRVTALCLCWTPAG